MIGFGFPDPRSWQLAPGSAAFWGTFGAIAGAVSITRLRADDRSICISFVGPLLRLTDLLSVYQLGYQPCVAVISGWPYGTRPFDAGLDMGLFPPSGSPLTLTAFQDMR